MVVVRVVRVGALHRLGGCSKANCIHSPVSTYTALSLTLFTLQNLGINPLTHFTLLQVSVTLPSGSPL